MKRRTQAFIATLFVLLSGLFVAARAQEFSTDVRHPTRLTSANMNGRVTPEQGKSFYVTFLAGPGDIMFDASVSPKQNNGAVFYWVVYHDPTSAVKDMPWCPEHLYLEESKRTKCVVAAGEGRMRQVVLKLGAYPNGEPVALDFSLNLTGDWKPIPLPPPVKSTRRRHP